MGLFRRTPLDPAADAGLRRAREAAGLAAGARILAAEPAETGWCVAQVDALAHGDSDEWRIVPWHLVERGGYNAQDRSLVWSLSDGRRGSVPLRGPGRLADIFRERVEATIVLEQHVPVEGTREGGVISARRDLASPDTVMWRVRRGRGTPDTPEVNELLDRRLAELRAEYA